MKNILRQAITSHPHPQFNITICFWAWATPLSFRPSHHLLHPLTKVKWSSPRRRREKGAGVRAPIQKCEERKYASSQGRKLLFVPSTKEFTAKLHLFSLKFVQNDAPNCIQRPSNIRKGDNPILRTAARKNVQPLLGTASYTFSSPSMRPPKLTIPDNVLQT